LNANNFTGSPPSFASLQQLTYLDLSDNQLTGPFPTISSPVFDTIQLSNNNFSGPIPESFFSLKKLRFILISFNQLTGTLSTAIGDIPTLYDFDFAYNQLEGTIPNTIRTLPALWSINLSANKFTGAFPLLPATVGYGNFMDNQLCSNSLPDYCSKANFFCLPNNGTCAGLNTRLPAIPMKFN